jgi:hypothetical protein
MRAPLVILAALRDVPRGCWQRTDGLRCSPEVLNLGGWSYTWSIRVLLFLGLIETRPSNDMRSLPTYRVAQRLLGEPEKFG